MANIKNIPDDDHFIRRALPGKHLVTNHVGQVVAFDQSLFRYRIDQDHIAKFGKAETSLSINWVEFFYGNEEEQINLALEDYRNGLLALPKPVDPGKCYFGKINVKEFKSKCSERGAKPRIIHDGKPTQSHGGITQLPQGDPILLEELCEMAFKGIIEKKFKKRSQND